MHPLLAGGFLIAIEGIDGAGKTTVSALLAQYFGERGIACTLSKEPTGLSYGRQLRESAKHGRLSVEEELDLFLKDRIDHARRSIRPTLDAGGVAILDRYYWSTAAYQGARGIDPRSIMTENEKHVPVPDLVILLDVSPELGLERIRTRGDIPNAFEKVRALEKARTIFQQLHEDSSYSVRIDGVKSLREVQGTVMQALATHISKTIEKRHLKAASVEAIHRLLEAGPMA